MDGPILLSSHFAFAKINFICLRPIHESTHEGDSYDGKDRIC